MTLRVGVVGAGNIATNRHIPAFQNADGVRLVALYDTDPAQATAVAGDTGIAAVDSLDKLLDATDLVSLCSPPTAHCEQTVAALEAGCHVLTEKPMAMSLDEADRMVEAADRSDAILSVVHNFLFMDSFRKARRLRDKGKLGTVKRSYAIMLEREAVPKDYLEAAGGGMRFWDEAPHVLYMTRAFLGDLSLTDAAVETSGESYRSIRTAFDGEDDARGHLVFLADSPLTEWWHVVVGSQGIACVDVFRDLVIRFDEQPSHSARHIVALLGSAIGQLTTGGLSAGLRYVTDRYAGYGIPEAGFATQVSRLVEAIETGTEPPVTGREGRKILADMERIREQTGLQVE